MLGNINPLHKQPDIYVGRFTGDQLHIVLNNTRRCKSSCSRVVVISLVIIIKKPKVKDQIVGAYIFLSRFITPLIISLFTRNVYNSIIFTMWRQAVIIGIPVFIVPYNYKIAYKYGIFFTTLNRCICFGCWCGC